MKLLLPHRGELTRAGVQAELKKAGILYTTFTYKAGITQPNGVTIYHIDVQET